MAVFRAFFRADYLFRLGSFSLLWRFVYSLRRRGFQRFYERFELLVFGQNRFGDDARQTG